MAKSPKFYVVWQGRRPDIYTSWAACEAQVKGFPDARFQSFATRAEAEAAFAAAPPNWRKPTPSAVSAAADSSVVAAVGGGASCLPTLPHGLNEAIVVDAACSGNPGQMEYRGVHLPSGRVIFHFGPIWGTNNIGEFLAIVHALALLEKEGKPKMTIFSDSRNAISWVRRKACKTTLAEHARSAKAYELIRRAEAWLKAHRITTPIVKWETQEWGEIPADFGRK